MSAGLAERCRSRTRPRRPRRIVDRAERLCGHTHHPPATPTIAAVRVLDSPVDGADRGCLRVKDRARYPVTGPRPPSGFRDCRLVGYRSALSGPISCAARDRLWVLARPFHALAGEHRALTRQFAHGRGSGPRAFPPAARSPKPLLRWCQHTHTRSPAGTGRCRRRCVESVQTQLVGRASSSCCRSSSKDVTDDVTSRARRWPSAGSAHAD